MAAEDFISSETKNLKTLPMPQETCPHCNVQGKMVGEVNYNYSAFFGIPIFGINTERIVVCTNCKKLYTWINMPPDLKQRLHEQTRDVKMTNKWRYFFGLILVVVVLLIVIISLNV